VATALGAYGLAKKRKKVHKISMNDIAQVDRPAQQPARAALIKRAEELPSLEEFFKVAFGDVLDAMDLTDSVGNAVSQVWRLVDALQVSTRKILEDREEYPDPREALRQSLQEFANVMASRVADAISVIVKDPQITKQGDTTMPDKTPEELVAEVTKRNERLEKMVTLTDAQRAFFKSLDTAGQDAFLEMDDTARDAEVAKAADEDPVVYKGMDGSEFRKSDDPRLIAMAKRDDQRATENALLRKQAEDAQMLALSKSDDYKFIPGSEATKVAMLKAVHAIPDAAQRDEALTALKAQNAEMAKAFNTVGTTSGGTAVDNATVNTLEKGASEIMKSDNSLTKEQAIAKYLSTPEGQAAYADMEATKRQ